MRRRRRSGCRCRLCSRRRLTSAQALSSRGQARHPLASRGTVPEASRRASARWLRGAAFAAVGRPGPVGLRPPRRCRSHAHRIAGWPPPAASGVFMCCITCARPGIGIYSDFDAVLPAGRVHIVGTTCQHPTADGHVSTEGSGWCYSVPVSPGRCQTLKFCTTWWRSRQSISTRFEEERRIDLTVRRGCYSFTSGGWSCATI